MPKGRGRLQRGPASPSFSRTNGRTKAAGGFAVVRVGGIVQDWGKANWERQPQILMDLSEAQRSLNYTGLINIVRVSNVGDVQAGVVHSAAVSRDLNRAVILNQMPLTVTEEGGPPPGGEGVLAGG